MRCYEPIFLYLLAKNNNAARQSEMQKLKQTISTSERRIQAIDKAIEGLFEANISGKITDERFTKMTANYEKEQKELLNLVADGNGGDSPKPTAIQTFFIKAEHGAALFQETAPYPTYIKLRYPHGPNECLFFYSRY